ncbi:LysR family transcriptional regulator [Azospirillum sp. HJ39]|uniref:LysR family transcriptional regulator n=1 Tax=Azospirillum sp. HJ39 TaxID=3159496 RepID=UPI00355720D6
MAARAAAAERLSLTQPAVSGMLTRLRETFDDPLFIRCQRGVLPTPRAEALAVPLRQALIDIQALLAPEAFVPARAAMTVTIAATDYAQKAVLLPLMSALRREAPGIRISVRPVDLSGFSQQMESGALDMALVTPVTTVLGSAVSPQASRQVRRSGSMALWARGGPVACRRSPSPSVRPAPRPRRHRRRRTRPRTLGGLQDEGRCPWNAAQHRGGGTTTLQTSSHIQSSLR